GHAGLAPIEQVYGGMDDGHRLGIAGVEFTLPIPEVLDLRFEISHGQRRYPNPLRSSPFGAQTRTGASASPCCRARGGRSYGRVRGVDLNQLNVRVGDPSVARQFYERWFGFREKFSDDGAVFLTNDDRFLLALFPAEAAATMPPGYHFGFNLDAPAA